MISVGECFRARLKIPGCIYYRISIVVILYYIEQTLHGIAFFTQAFQLPVDTRHRHKHLCDVPGALLHVLCRIAIESESRGR